MYQTAAPMTVSCVVSWPTNDPHVAPVASAETRYATGTRAAAIKSGLREMRNLDSLREVVIHARSATTATMVDNIIFAWGTLTHDTGMKKNGSATKRRNTDHRVSAPDHARYCIAPSISHTQSPLRGIVCASIWSTISTCLLGSRKAKHFCFARCAPSYSLTFVQTRLTRKRKSEAFSLRSFVASVSRILSGTAIYLALQLLSGVSGSLR